mmetsp:Transcript_100880/g.314488  ORF Transcript_100880/g.314488 Transcript_100880/m.314488 type:complete len:215 (-) Transcript_100880:1278-1922(-)
MSISAASLCFLSAYRSDLRHSHSACTQALADYVSEAPCCSFCSSWFIRLRSTWEAKVPGAALPAWVAAVPLPASAPNPAAAPPASALPAPASYALPAPTSYALLASASYALPVPASCTLPAPPTPAVVSAPGGAHWLDGIGWSSRGASGAASAPVDCAQIRARGSASTPGTGRGSSSRWRCWNSWTQRWSSTRSARISRTRTEVMPSGPADAVS